ncbi:MAG: hypothetical protein HOV80_19775 [Polyangiaceae bacterium]|nr:hypothetical protein [Polyangiaceae bacterium]
MNATAPAILFALLCVHCGARTSLDDGDETIELGPTPLADSRIIVLDFVEFMGQSRITGLDDMQGNGRVEYLGDGTFRQSCHPVFDPEGRLYFVDAGDGYRMIRLDLETGEMVTLDATSGVGIAFPSSIAFDAAGRIYFTEPPLNRVSRVDDMDGSGFVSFGGPLGGAGVGELSEPLGIEVTADGKILVADRKNRRIVQMDDMEGNGWTSWDVPDGWKGRASPTDVAVDGEGRILIVDFQSSLLHRIDDISGAGHTSQQLIEQLNHVFVHDDGTIYLSFLNGENAIGSMPEFGGELTVYDGGDDELQNPCGIAVY